MSRTARRLSESQVRCPRCGSVQTIFRRRGHLRKAGHIKHLWCPYCKARTGHVELDAAEGRTLAECPA